MVELKKASMRAVAVMVVALGLFTGGAGMVAAQNQNPTGITIQNGQSNDNDSDQDADQDSGQFAQVSGSNEFNQAGSIGGNSSANENETEQGNSLSVSDNDISGGDDISEVDVDITVTVINQLIFILTTIFGEL